MYRFTLLIFISLLVLLHACVQSTDDFEPDFGWDYYPLQLGNFLEYEVDSTIFDPAGSEKVRHSRTLVKEIVTDTFEDLTGNTTFRIERFERKADSVPWQINKVFTASISGFRAYRTEDNLRFIKMVFPPSKNKTWNGNVHFNNSLIVTVAGESLEMFKGWVSKIKSVNIPDTIGTKKFPESVTIQLAESENLIELRYGVEKYARGIGLIYRELWILDTQCIEKCQGKSWAEKAEKGFILKQSIIGWN